MIRVVLNPEASRDPMAFTAYCNERMPCFAPPRCIRPMDALPKNVMGPGVTKDDLRCSVTAGSCDRELAGYEPKR